MNTKYKVVKIEEHTVSLGSEHGSLEHYPKEKFNFQPRLGDLVEVFSDVEYNDEGVGVYTKDVVISKVINEQDNQQGPAGVGATINEDGNKTFDKNIFVWLFVFLLGHLGVDRFLRGKIASGVCKLLFNWLTLGIWNLVDWIIAMVKAYGSSFGSVTYLEFGSETGAYTR